MTIVKSIKSELEIIDSLLKDKAFAETMAMELEATWYKANGETVPPFLKPGEDTLQIDKSLKEEKIATNIAGFYALECGLNYLVSTKKQTPSSILKSIIDDSIAEEDKLLFCHFANATWKAGQPFRSLDRIERDTFTVFNFLSDEDVEKDWIQIKTAAAKLQMALK